MENTEESMDPKNLGQVVQGEHYKNQGNVRLNSILNTASQGSTDIHVLVQNANLSSGNPPDSAPNKSSPKAQDMGTT